MSLAQELTTRQKNRKQANQQELRRAASACTFSSSGEAFRFGKQLSRSQAALGNRNTARDSQVASHAISTEVGSVRRALE